MSAKRTEIRQRQPGNIHLNPVRAETVKKPEGYGWVGHLSYLGKGREPLEEGLVLEQFSNIRSLARRRERQFVWTGISRGQEIRYHQVKEP